MVAFQNAIAAFGMVLTLAGCSSPANPATSHSLCSESHCIVSLATPPTGAFAPLASIEAVVTTVDYFDATHVLWRESSGTAHGSVSLWSLDVSSGQMTPVFERAGYGVTDATIRNGTAMFSTWPIGRVSGSETYSWSPGEGLQGLQQPAWAPTEGIFQTSGDGWAGYFIRTGTTAHYSIFEQSSGRLLLEVPGTTEGMAPPSNAYVNGVTSLDGKLVLPWHSGGATGTSLVETDPWTGLNRTLFTTSHNLDNGFSLSPQVMTFIEGPQNQLWAYRVSDGKDIQLSQPGWWTPWANQEGAIVYYLREQIPADRHEMNFTTVLTRLDVATMHQEDWTVQGPGHSLTGCDVHDGRAYVSMVEQMSPPRSVLYAMQLPNSAIR
ncbi:MAG: hypothetical protein ABR562_01610 [Thermoplasmatota archaeon]